MKTLVIHPTDPTTDFLIPVYADKDWTIIRKIKSKSDLKEQIKNHDRIIMLGHGTEQGLLYIHRENYSIVDWNYYIDSSLVYLLREKQCVCIWCNANKFVDKYDLKGFYTGMIISEFEEAMIYCVSCKDADIKESNDLFTESVKNSISSLNMIEEMKSSYTTIENPIINFNKENLFQR